MLVIMGKKEEVWEQASKDAFSGKYWHMCNQLLFETDIPYNAYPAQYLETCHEHGWGPFAVGSWLAEYKEIDVITIVDEDETLDVPNLSNLSSYFNELTNDSTVDLLNMLLNEDDDTGENFSDDIVFLGEFKKGENDNYFVHHVDDSDESFSLLDGL